MQQPRGKDPLAWEYITAYGTTNLVSEVVRDAEAAPSARR